MTIVPVVVILRYLFKAHDQVACRLKKQPEQKRHPSPCVELMFNVESPFLDTQRGLYFFSLDMPLF